jgi:hypothetical protein
MVAYFTGSDDVFFNYNLMVINPELRVNEQSSGTARMNDSVVEIIPPSPTPFTLVRLILSLASELTQTQISFCEVTMGGTVYRFFACP